MDFAKKRKVDKECRKFNKDWMAKYFFTEVGKKAVCLLCNESVAVFKKYNISRHYATKHAGYGSTLSAMERQTIAIKLDRRLIKQQNVVVKAKTARKTATHVLSEETATVSSGDTKRPEVSSNFYKTDKSENAMLRSRIEEQGKLICFLKQRADQQLNRLNTLEEVNNELHLLRTQALEESQERMRSCNMLERRFYELNENHEDMIKIKDEYKFQCNTLAIENKSLKDQIRRQFSEAISGRDDVINELKKKLSASDVKMNHTLKRNAELEKKLNELNSSHSEKLKILEANLEKAKSKNDDLAKQLHKLKHARDQLTNKESEKIAALKKENSRLLDEIMERGKLLQERQSDVDESKMQLEKKEAQLKSLVDDFNRKKDQVNSNLKVQKLQKERDEMETELIDLKRKFEAFRIHSNNLLEQEKDLNSKLRNNVIAR